MQALVGLFFRLICSSEAIRPQSNIGLNVVATLGQTWFTRFAFLLKCYLLLPTLGVPKGPGVIKYQLLREQGW